jgi:hypothetical protein
MNLFPARGEQAACQRPLLRSTQLRIAMEEDDMIKAKQKNHCNAKQRSCLL